MAGENLQPAERFNRVTEVFDSLLKIRARNEPRGAG
jgi:hypothetical protein